ncbi:glycosyltransferase family protein [Clostridium manihotivorum]|uniref:Streptomycin biosynthesis protein StrF domain-containing protein n=1 Tax=Clostridium manihotivorum TaxID=2320868 RepID=A0A410DNE1_9CLOT|nr:glycosyltransferase family protein [Clostridium manihotivorum]QAA30588.1 hypothetical protein C1I91_02290 [Clostridium manihotivorum]
MNDRKIAFITSVNDKELYDESKFYIQQLNKPEGFQIEFMKIEDASSLANAYNIGMNSSDAKYKVFMHQDVFIVNKNFLYDILKVFKTSEAIGMIGVAGCKYIPESGIWWEADQTYGKVADSHNGVMQLLSFREVSGDYEEVAALDGLIMITQYDIPWREDVFSGWHFYDISQSLEFKKKGYKVVVPRQDNLWCIHDCGVIDLGYSFEEERIKLLREYAEELSYESTTN